MRVQVITYHGSNGEELSRSTKDFSLPSEEEDEDSFAEAVTYLQENIIDAYESDGVDIEVRSEDEHEKDVDTLAVWELPEWFDTKKDAKLFLAEFIPEIESWISDLE